ncbi:MAG: cupredoxin domain-containing protein, partial [Chloroflexi bacterium]|nr:cupredoxin domain-containing protein [Chloroflexota bacterium]
MDTEHAEDEGSPLKRDCTRVESLRSQWASWMRLGQPWLPVLSILVIVMAMAPAPSAVAWIQQTPVAEEIDILPAAIHEGTCEDPVAEPAFILTNLAPRSGDDLAAAEEAFRGTPTGSLVLASETTVDVPFDDLLDRGPYAIAVHESVAGFGSLLACGEIGGVEVDSRVVVGLRSVERSGAAGIAILDDDDSGFLGLGEDQTQISVYLMRDLGLAVTVAPVPAEEPAAATTPRADTEATPVEDGATDGDDDEAAAEEVTVEMVDIDFNPNEFSIPANTDVTVHLPNL